MRQYIFHICVVLMFFMVLTPPVSAQGVPVTPGIDLSSSIQSPSPGQNITISAKSYNTDLNSTTLIWSINGTEIKRGVGATTLNTTAPLAGKINNVSVTAIALDGTRLTGSLSLGSGSVDLIIESDGYVPALFLGKVHPTYENKIKVIAIPHMTQTNGTEYDPNTLIYEWRKNETILENQSGYGKSSLTLEGSLIPRVFTVSVTVKNRSGENFVNGLITISPEQSSLGMYVDDPLYGPLFNKAIINQINLGSQRESAVIATPYGFNVSPTGNVSYEWTINGSIRSDLLKNQSIIIRSPEGTTGSSNISLKVKNSRNILQTAIGGFNVSFSPARGQNKPEVTF